MYSLMSTRMSADWIGEQELRQRARELGLSDAGRSAEDERADRTIRILEAGAAAADRARERLDRLVLRRRPTACSSSSMRSRRAVSASCRRVTGMPVQRLTMNDDLLLAEHRAVRLAPLLPLVLLLADLALQLALLVAQRRRALEVLIANRGFLLGVHALELILELRPLPAAATCAARRARAPASSITSIALSGRKRSVM